MSGHCPDKLYSTYADIDDPPAIDLCLFGCGLVALTGHKRRRMSGSLSFNDLFDNIWYFDFHSPGKALSLC